MEGLQKVIRNGSKEPRQCPSSASSSFENPPPPIEGLSTALSSSDHSRILIRPPREVVSLWACSKLCAICFAVGVVVGFTLKQRVRRWASRILKQLKED